jgi:DNA-binding transcriptional ArsR family regulator
MRSRYDGNVEDLLEAIAHPGRRAMLRVVLDREASAGELAGVAGLKQPAASQHLRILRDAGLVDVRVDGSRRLYRANADGVERLRAELDAFWRPSLASLKRAAERRARERR